MGVRVILDSRLACSAVYPANLSIKGLIFRFNSPSVVQFFIPRLGRLAATTIPGDRRNEESTIRIYGTFEGRVASRLDELGIVGLE